MIPVCWLLRCWRRPRSVSKRLLSTIALRRSRRRFGPGLEMHWRPRARKQFCSVKTRRVPQTRERETKMMHSSRKVWTAVLAVAGCVGVATSARAVELTFWTNLTTAAQANVIQKQINECLPQQAGLTVKFETVPFGAMYTRLITALRRNDAPNVMNTIEGAVAFMQAKNGLEPVTDLIDRLGAKDFTASYLHAVSKDGQVWGLPDWALHQEVWYRKDLFAKAGLKPPRSWDELLQAAKALTVAGADGKPAQFGFAVPMGRALVAPQ